jgi:hypothetical protein
MVSSFFGGMTPRFFSLEKYTPVRGNQKSFLLEGGIVTHLDVVAKRALAYGQILVTMGIGNSRTFSEGGYRRRSGQPEILCVSSILNF